MKPKGANMKSQKPTPLPLRLEPGLRAWLQVKARENKRSMNGEISFLLERYRAQKSEASHG